jgi:hypothetical protein
MEKLLSELLKAWLCTKNHMFVRAADVEPKTFVQVLKALPKRINQPTKAASRASY